MNTKNPIKRTHPWRAPSQPSATPSAASYLPNRQFRVIPR